MDKMTDEEKSVLLARLMGWIHPAGDGFLPGIWMIKTPHPNWTNNYWKAKPTILPGFNLYDEKYMALAWRILNWAFDTFSFTREGATVFVGGEGSLFRIPPSEAQRKWLDDILSIAIEAGILQDDH